MLHRHRVLALVLIALVGVASVAQAQGKIPTPKEHYGFNIGDDYVLANYTETEAYWKKLDQASDRMTLVDIGKTAEGRTQWMAIITSPDNHKRLEQYRTITSRLHQAVGLTDDEARKLASEGKAVVWIDGGLHATEVVGAQSLVEFVYQMVSRTDAETVRFLNDVITLCVFANPDGMELVSNWYMRIPDPPKRSSGGLPRLYQKYAGHDNNRDSYMVNLNETANMNRVMFRQWYPQIMYNHHQTGPAGTVEFMPPFRDPFNYYYDPLIPLGIELVGTAMHSRMAAEGKPGTTMRSGANYSTWWNGGLRTTAYFQNVIGLLTEIIGNPTPMEIPFVPQRQLPTNDYPFPITPQRWHMRQSIEYEITANRAVLDVASRYRDTFLFNLYTMGKNHVARGSKDTWTTTPRRLAAVQAQIARDTPAPAAGGRGGGRGGAGGGGRGGAASKYFEMLRKPEDRDPRGYILPSDQPDFLTATKFVNALLKNGVTVHRATAAFEVAGKKYPAGSYVLKAAQAARAMVLDLLEPQDHPDDFAYPGGPPRPPYDSAGWTLAYQMNVKFDRILEGFDGPFEEVPDVINPPKGSIVAPKGKAAGYLVSGQVNDAFVAINRLLASGEDVYRLTGAMTEGSASFVPGSVYVAAKATTAPQIQKLADEVGLTFVGTAARVPATAIKLKKVRIGLWDRYGGSMPSGWTRFLFEQFGFPFEVVYPQALDAGDLASKYDVLVFVDGAIPARETGGGADAFTGGQPQSSNIPEEYKAQLGNITIAKTVPALKKFVEDGGRLLAIGSSTAIGQHFGLPITDALVEKAPDGTIRSLPSDKFYIPGSILQTAVDNTNPVAWGLEPKLDVFFDNSPAFILGPDAPLKGLRAVAWYDSASPLRSGWAWGQGYLQGAVAVAEATMGKGKVFIYGPEVAFRAQPHGTYKLLFNAIYFQK